MRDIRLDAAKGILIILVALGHLAGELGGWDDPVLRFLLTGIYMFHMPAFVFLTAITSKNDNLPLRVGRLVVLLLVMQLAYTIPLTLITGSYPTSILAPYWILWFLLSLICWMILLPFIERFPKISLWGSIAVALVVGYLPFVGGALSLSRTLLFLPFFVAGHTYGKKMLRWTGRVRVTAAVASVLGIVAIAAGLYAMNIDGALFRGSSSYAETGTGPVVRLGLLLAAAACVVLFLLAVRGSALMARTGRTSLPIYVFHGAFVLAVVAFVNPPALGFGSWATLAACLILAAAIVAITAQTFFDDALRAISDKPVQRILKGRMTGRRAKVPSAP